jgi:hypothetical protein
MLNEATWQFVRQHADDDVRQLALRGCKDRSVDLSMALQQIQGRQTARRKLPTWAAREGIIYPPHLSLEQCSSEQTARYKARIARELCADIHQDTKLIDLTGGFGVDFALMSEVYAEAVYVEQQPELHAIVQANLQTLGLRHATAVCADAIDFLHQTDHATLIFIDPARRDSHGARTYGICDCAPNVLPLMNELLEKADHVMLKLSPMLDWRKAVADIGAGHVEQVHIVAVEGECKELLLVLSAQGSPQLQLVCANDEQTDEFEGLADSPLSVADERVAEGTFLYEPNAALMKAGVFHQLEKRYNVKQLAPNSHLFISAEMVERFPGRTFQIEAVSTMNKRELKEKILPLAQANIAVRNFPTTVAELRRRLKLSEGGGNYIFATTLASNDKVLIVCQRKA